MTYRADPKVIDDLAGILMRSYGEHAAREAALRRDDARAAGEMHDAADWEAVRRSIAEPPARTG